MVTEFGYILHLLLLTASSSTVQKLASSANSYFSVAANPSKRFLLQLEYPEFIPLYSPHSNILFFLI